MKKQLQILLIEIVIFSVVGFGFYYYFWQPTETPLCFAYSFPDGQRFEPEYFHRYWYTTTASIDDVSKFYTRKLDASESKLGNEKKYWRMSSFAKGVQYQCLQRVGRMESASACIYLHEASYTTIIEMFWNRSDDSPACRSEYSTNPK